jgi:hypothetical protein
MVGNKEIEAKAELLGVLEYNILKAGFQDSELAKF